MVNPKMTLSTWSFLADKKIYFLLVWLTYLIVFYIADLYDYQQDYRRLSNIAKVIISAWIATLAVIVIFYFPLGAFIGRTQLIIQATIFTGLLVLWRWTFSVMVLTRRLQRQLLIVGAGKSGTRLLAAIRNRPNAGLAPIGFVDDDPQKMGADIKGLPVLGNSSGLEEIISRHNLNLVVVAITQEKSAALITALTRICWHGCQVTDMPTFYEILTGKVPIEHISDLWFYLHSVQANKLYYRHFKRWFDLGLAIVGLVFTLPLFIFISLAIKLDSRGPIFFRQTRLGRDGLPFRIIKFRTMIEDSEKDGPQWANGDDPRITRAGRILRRYRLDELPQLCNILKGDMSFIGPRPERKTFIQQFRELIPDLRPGRRDSDPPGLIIQQGVKEKIPYYSHRLIVRPGITGWAQVSYPYASSPQQTREKLKYDLYYLKNMSFFLDLAILLKTIRIVLFGRGI